MTDELTIEKLMGLMPKAFLPEKAEGVDKTMQFNFSGDEAGDWVVTIKDGACTVDQGTIEDPSLAINVASSDWLQVFTGKANAMALFAAGKIKLKGDLNLAMQMMNYFKMT